MITYNNLVRYIVILTCAFLFFSCTVICPPVVKTYKGIERPINEIAILEIAPITRFSTMALKMDQKYIGYDGLRHKKYESTYQAHIEPGQHSFVVRVFLTSGSYVDADIRAHLEADHKYFVGSSAESDWGPKNITIWIDDLNTGKRIAQETFDLEY